MPRPNLTNEASYKKLLNRLRLGSLAYFITMVLVFGTYKHSTIPLLLQADGETAGFTPLQLTIVPSGVSIIKGR